MSMGKRTLADLYVIGEEAKIDDGRGDPIKIWIQKMSPVEHKRALTKAGAARARKLALTRQPDSDEYLAAYSDIVDFADGDDLIHLAFRDEIYAKKIVVEAELQAEDEWSEHDYLEGLMTAWEGEPPTEAQQETASEDGGDALRSSAGLKEAYHDPEHDDHDEAVKVFEEIKRFSDLVETRFDAERLRILEDAREMDRDELVHKATRKFLEQSASSAFLDEYHEWEMFLSVRRPEDHHKYYFGSRDELDSLTDEVKAALTSHVVRITVEPDEGKDSAGIPPSSPSAGQPNTEGPEPASTPADATA